MLKVQVFEGPHEISGVSKKTGRPYSMRKQNVHVTLPGERFPVRVEIGVEDNEAGYTPGDYMLSPESFFLGEHNSLRLGRIKLAPMPAKAVEPVRKTA